MRNIECEWADHEARRVLMERAVSEMFSSVFRRAVLVAESGQPSKCAEELKKPLQFLLCGWLYQDSPGGKAELTFLVSDEEKRTKKENLLVVQEAIAHAYHGGRTGSFWEWRQASWDLLARLALEAVEKAGRFFYKLEKESLLPLQAEEVGEEDVAVLQLIGAVSIHQRVILW
jgi:hypothetical protein